MQALRKASCDVTMVGGTIAGSWREPESIDGTETQIELEYDPQVYWAVCTAAGGTQGVVRLTSVTKSGFTLTSSNALDTSTYRVFAACRMADLGG